MLSITNLVKSFGQRVLFDHITLQMSSGEKLGLVGRNGHGKSTLFKIILGEETYDEGSLTFPKNYKVGHLAQHLNFKEPNVLAEASLGLPLDERDQTYRAESILFGLGFVKSDMTRAPSEFSGGFQIRLNLAIVLVSEPNLLLLDEPTNYLDIISIRWLIKFLRQWKNELMLITHDRSFMDQVTTHTALIHRGKIKKISGGVQKILDQVHLEEEIHEKTRLNDAKKRKEIEDFINTFKAQASKAALVQSRIKMLEKMPQYSELSQIKNLDFKFNYAPTMTKILLELDHVDFHYESNSTKLDNMPHNLIKNFSISIKHGEKIAIIGKNGKGKSTLLNLMAQKLKPTHGEVKLHQSARCGHFGQTNIETLSPRLTVEEEINSVDLSLSKTYVRNICATMMFTQDDATKKISVLSGGEKSRVLLGKILAQQNNVLFLDEPTNHLDMESIEALTLSLQNFPGTVVIVTHSETLLKKLPQRFIIFQHDEQQLFDGSYDEFLAKVGWEEEKIAPHTTDQDQSLVSANKSMQIDEYYNFDEENSSQVTSVINKKDQHRQRLELNKEKNKVLSPLKKELDLLEQKIMLLEARLQKMNADIVALISENKTTEMIKLSGEVKKLEKEIDYYFSQLETKSDFYQKEELRFSALLNSL